MREPVRAALRGVMHSIEQALTIVLRHGPCTSTGPKFVVAFVSAEKTIHDVDAHPAPLIRIILFFDIAEIRFVVLGRVFNEPIQQGKREMERLNIFRPSRVNRQANRRLQDINHGSETLYSWCRQR